MENHSKSTGGREAIARANRIKSTLNLAAHKDFGQEYGEWTPGGNPAGYFTYSHLGIEVRLRFSQDNIEWTATCPKLKIETTFPHQPPQDIQNLLNDWIMDHIDRGISFRTRLRRSTPAVQDFAKKYQLSIADADEMLRERAL
jgi:hypothetical protein